MPRNLTARKAAIVLGAGTKSGLHLSMFTKLGKLRSHPTSLIIQPGGQRTSCSCTASRNDERNTRSFFFYSSPLLAEKDSTGKGETIPDIIPHPRITMAKTKPQPSSLHPYSNLKKYLHASLILLASRLPCATAQLQDPSLDAPSSMAPPVPDTDSTFDDSPSAASTTSAISRPSSTDMAEYASNNSHAPQDTGVLNFYFLLLIIVVIILALAWWTVARQRRKRLSHMRNSQRSILARDLEVWPGRRVGGGAWRFNGAEPREHDGLDERGEAPPPYIKQPDPVHHTDGPATELHDLSRAEVKPPDYVESSARR